MKCPFCGSADTQVIDSRVSEAGDSIRRRRRCTACQKRFTTYETVELRLPQVVKTNGDRAEFDAGRLRIGFARALHKRPVPTEFVDAAIDRIVKQILKAPQPAVLAIKEFARVAPSMDIRGAVDYARSLHAVINSSSEMRP